MAFVYHAWRSRQRFAVRSALKTPSHELRLAKKVRRLLSKRGVSAVPRGLHVQLGGKAACHSRRYPPNFFARVVPTVTSHKQFAIAQSLLMPHREFPFEPLPRRGARKVRFTSPPITLAGQLRGRPVLSAIALTTCSEKERRAHGGCEATAPDRT